MLELGGTFIPISFSCCVTCALILSALDLSHCDPIEEFIAPSPIPAIVVLLPPATASTSCKACFPFNAFSAFLTAASLERFLSFFR